VKVKPLIPYWVLQSTIYRVQSVYSPVSTTFLNCRIDKMPCSYSGCYSPAPSNNFSTGGVSAILNGGANSEQCTLHIPCIASTKPVLGLKFERTGEARAKAKAGWRKKPFKAVASCQRATDEQHPASQCHQIKLCCAETPTTSPTPLASLTSPHIFMFSSPSSTLN